MFKREVQTVADILAKCLREGGLETPLMQRRAIEAWEKVAGPMATRYTGEKFIKNQTLFVKILNPALRSNLSMSKSQLLANINAEVGCRVIVDIRFY